MKKYFLFSMCISKLSIASMCFDGELTYADCPLTIDNSQHQISLCATKESPENIWIRQDLPLQKPNIYLGIQGKSNINYFDFWEEAPGTGAHSLEISYELNNREYTLGDGNSGYFVEMKPNSDEIISFIQCDIDNKIQYSEVFPLTENNLLIKNSLYYKYKYGIVVKKQNVILYDKPNKMTASNEKLIKGEHIKLIDNYYTLHPKTPYFIKIRKIKNGGKIIEKWVDCNDIDTCNLGLPQNYDDTNQEYNKDELIDQGPFLLKDIKDISILYRRSSQDFNLIEIVKITQSEESTVDTIRSVDNKYLDLESVFFIKLNGINYIVNLFSWEIYDQDKTKKYKVVAYKYDEKGSIQLDDVISNDITLRGQSTKNTHFIYDNAASIKKHLNKTYSK